MPDDSAALGPNLNLFGQRDRPSTAPTRSTTWWGRARAAAKRYGYELEHVQSNHEGALIDAIHGAPAGARRS